MLKYVFIATVVNLLLSNVFTFLAKPSTPIITRIKQLILMSTRISIILVVIIDSELI